MGMFRKIGNFFRRLFRSRGFRATAKTVFWLFMIYCVTGTIHTLFLLMDLGFTFRESAYLMRDAYAELSLSAGGIGLGVIIGLIWFFRRRRKKAEAEQEEAEEQEQAASAEPAPLGSSEPAREEEFVETKYFNANSR